MGCLKQVKEEINIIKWHIQREKSRKREETKEELT